MKKIILSTFLLSISLIMIAQKVDLQQHLRETRTMISEKKYKEALKRCIWFHDHALEIDESMYGVRLSFALSDWKKLADEYPPALTALQDIRDKKTKTLMNNQGNFDLFHDVTSINRTLNEEDKSIALFESISNNNFELAKSYFRVISDVLYDAKRYDILSKFVANIYDQYQANKNDYDANVALYDRFGENHKTYNENRFTQQSKQLIQLALYNKDSYAANEIYQNTIGIIKNEKLQASLKEELNKRYNASSDNNTNEQTKNTSEINTNSEIKQNTSINAVNLRTVLNPYIDREQEERVYFSIDKITINDTNTTIDFRLTPLVNGIGLYMSDPPNTTIWQIAIGDNKYKMISNTFPGKSKVTSYGLTAYTPVTFTAVFEPIPVSTTQFDIVDNPATFCIYGVDLTKKNVPLIENWGNIGSDEALLKIETDKTSGKLSLIDEKNIKWVFTKNGNGYECREKNTTYTITYQSPTSIVMKGVTVSDFMGMTNTRTNTYRIVKDMRSHLDDPVNELNKYGMVFRYTYNFGKIGEDYVPAYYSTYNAGKKFYIEGIEIQEDDFRTYVSNGGYTNDVSGYTYVYQIINPSNKTYKIKYNMLGNGLYPNIEKTSFWNLFGGKYETIDEYKNFSLSNFIIIKPNETYKDQVKIGTKKPIDMQFNITSVEEISQEWLNNLQTALTTSTDVNFINNFINDPKASDWQPTLKARVDKINTDNKNRFVSQNLAFIKTSAKPKNDLMFDKDFESDVLYTIKNTSTRSIEVVYSVCGGKEQKVNLIAGEVFQSIVKSKGISKESLSVKIITINQL